MYAQSLIIRLSNIGCGLVSRQICRLKNPLRERGGGDLPNDISFVEITSPVVDAHAFDLSFAHKKIVTCEVVF